MAPINVYEKKQMDVIRGYAPDQKETMRGFIQVNTRQGGCNLINTSAISVVEPDPSDDMVTLIWVVDRNDPIEAQEPFTKIKGWIWNSMK